MSIQAIIEIFAPKSSLLTYSNFFGDPAIALLLSVLVAIFTFGINRGKKIQEVKNSISSSIASIGMILLIIGGGGAFKQVIIDSGVDKYIAHMMQGYVSYIHLLLFKYILCSIKNLSDKFRSIKKLVVKLYRNNKGESKK